MRNVGSKEGLAGRNMLALFRSVLIAMLMVLGGAVSAAPLDARAEYAPWLQVVLERLDDAGIDVLPNLNHRELARGRPDRPRLGGFPDLPEGRYPTTAEILQWEAAYLDLQLGGLALIAVENNQSPAADYEEFLSGWYAAGEGQRVFVTFSAANRQAVDSIRAALAEAGMAGMIFLEGQPVSQPGRLYATAGVRLALDSNDARRLRNDVAEIDFLGRRTRRDTDSIFPDGIPVARSEPAVFRKQTLGDEYEASTIEEIVVPGGIAFGEEAELPADIVALTFEDEALYLVDTQGGARALPQADIATVKALFDFVQRSELLRSDAIVDIDAEGRVAISAALADTDVGYRFIEIDTEPFNFVRRLPVNKSVIIDTAVEFEPVPGLDEMQYSTVYEIRFLSADTMRIAQTRVALEYEISQPQGVAEHSYSWGRDVGRLDENLDYDGLGSKTAELGEFAAWAALFRTIARQDLTFLRGRYEFMKLDKAGRNTPARY